MNSSSMLKQSHVSSLTSNMGNLKHSQSYNELLNLRSTLLQMQYLYSSLTDSLQKQHNSQHNQHKDHLIQCFNLKEELQDLKTSNFTKLLIVKLEEFLALEEQQNQKLIQQPITNIQSIQNINNIQNTKFLKQSIRLNKPSNQSDQLNGGQFMNQFQHIALIDRYMSLVLIKQEEMQQSLCKLYVGNKVFLDLEKTSSSIEAIESKIDQFLLKNNNTLSLYKERLNELQQTKTTFTQYLQQVQTFLPDSQNNQTQLKTHLKQLNVEQIKARTISKQLYEKHVNSRLGKQQIQIEKRISQLKSQLLLFQ